MRIKSILSFDVLFVIFVIGVHVWGLLKLPNSEKFRGWSQTLSSIGEAKFLSLLVIALSVISLVVICFKEFQQSHSQWLSGIFLGVALGSLPSTTNIGQTLILIALAVILRNLDEKNI